jgi:hypothetical protein
MLEEHIAVHQNKSDREVLWCPYDSCMRAYYHKRNLTHHIKSSHEGNKYECTFLDCGTKLCTQQKLMYIEPYVVSSMVRTAVWGV